MEKNKWIFLLTLISFLIATFYSVIKLTSLTLDPYSLAFSRFLGDFIGLGVFLFLQKNNLVIHKKDWLPLIFLGIVGQVFSILGLTFGTKVTNDSSTVSLLVNTTSFWIFLVVVICRLDKFIWRRFIGILIGLAGIFLVIFGQNSFSFDFSLSIIFGYLSALIASFVLVVFGIFIEKYSKNYSALKATFYCFVFPALFLFFCVLFNNSSISLLFVLNNIFIGFYSGFISLGIARLITVAALKKIQLVIVYPFCFLIPLFTMILRNTIFQDKNNFIFYY